ncbi:hypothetical protein [Spirochaeta africana]|uniref:Uncharacterized protein n=1 Tax=Spirochaeta africana (strain ATCC 700263 / DSM 8902 / Z-7692) TaxID=889378 RepID=H9UJS3_SPIAZ|nr:hypothetical protein [Spirochaeta africana]AFG37766.1 hypothetical protein Spiaf_1709 [Spirochaeta africana DSM 8902]
MEYTNHLYLILYPNPSLVASQYNPQQFARHYISGSTRYYDGKVLFAEIDINYRHPHFAIEEGLAQLVPHEDGRPKATKFISIYRVLEHIDFDAIQKLYLTSPEAAVLELEPANDDVKTREPGILRIFAEITPLRMLVLTKLDFIEFGRSITAENDMRSVPSLFYTQLEFDTESFLQDFEHNPLMQPPIPGLHPSKLRDAIFELQSSRDKTSKGLALDSSFDKIPYRFIRHGFMFAAGSRYRFFRMPANRDIEESNYKFWKSM